MATKEKICICEHKAKLQNHDDGGHAKIAPPRHTPVADEHKSTLASVRSATRNEGITTDD